MTKEKMYEMQTYRRRRCSFMCDRKQRDESVGMAACPCGANEGRRITEECVALVSARVEENRGWASTQETDT